MSLSLPIGIDRQQPGTRSSGSSIEVWASTEEPVKGLVESPDGGGGARAVPFEVCSPLMSSVKPDVVSRGSRWWCISQRETGDELIREIALCSRIRRRCCPENGFSTVTGSTEKEW